MQHLPRSKTQELFSFEVHRKPLKHVESVELHRLN